MPRWFLLAALLLALLPVSDPRAQDVPDGTRRVALASVLSGRPAADAVSTLMSLADMGDAEAAQVLGYAFAKGRGMMQDLPASFRWYLRAVVAGHQDSMLDAIKVWRGMSGARQQEAERLLRRSFDANEVRRLKEVWSETAANFAAAQDEARRRAARGSG